MNRRLARRDRARAAHAQTHGRIHRTCALCGHDRPVRKFVYTDNRTGLGAIVAVCTTCVEEDGE